MGTCANFSMLSLPRSTAGLAVTSKGILCTLSACWRNMLIAWVVPMPGSEKSFAASSLVFLSMRTVTLAVVAPAAQQRWLLRAAETPGVLACR